MIVNITDHTYIKAVRALLGPGEELPIDILRLKSAYNIVSEGYALASGFIIEFGSDVDATLFLLKFS